MKKNNLANATGTASDRQKKKQKGGMENPPILDPAIWAAALAFLPYRDIRSASVLNKFFLGNVSSLVETLFVYDWREMHERGPARRFGNVKNVHIRCLLKCDPGDGYYHVMKFVCADTSTRVVSFLSSFPLAEKAWLGGWCTDYVDVDGGDTEPMAPHFISHCDDYSYEDRLHGSSEKLKEMFRLICAAYKSGTLPQSLSITGIDQCPEHYGCEGECSLCSEMFQSFPLQDLVTRKRCSCLYPTKCSSTKKRFEAIVGRPGGIDQLKSASSFYELLKRSSFVNTDVTKRSNDSTGLVVFYRPDTLEDMKLLCKHGCKPRELSPSEAFRAIMDRVTNDDGTPLDKSKYNKHCRGTSSKRNHYRF